jgi:hypothetical protein
MDQLRKVLTWLKQQHFWVLSVVIALVSLGCWWKASGQLRAEYAKNEQTIKAEFGKLDQLRKEPFHPNDKVNEKQTAEVEKQGKNAQTLWQAVYDRQREKVLAWPPELGQDFLAKIEKLQFGNDIPRNLRQIYQDYVDRHFKTLPEQIKARPLADNEVGGGAGAFAGRFAEGPSSVGATGAAPDDGDYVCEWAEADQNYIRENLHFARTPSALLIWVRQEDLWVYHTLLDVIANTNQAANATRISNAAVQRVLSLEVGQRAAYYSRTPGRLLLPPPAPAAAAGEAGPAGGGPPGGAVEGPAGGRAPMARPGGERVGTGPGGQMSEEDERRYLLSDRYLNPVGLPISLGGGDAAAGGDAGGGPPPAPAPSDVPASPAAPLDVTQFGTEYKSLPVRMVLMMDQKWLPYLLAQCGSQPLQVEVKEVRINPADGGGVEGGPSGGGFVRRGGFEGGAPGGGSLFGEVTGVQSFRPHPNLVQVVIQGVVYIFNKPNAEKLKIATEGQAPPTGT